MEDHEIVCLYWARDQEAVRRSQAKYGEPLRRLACRILHSEEDAEECVSDTWLKAWQTIPPQRPEEQRLIFLRRYWYADPVREIARRYGIGESSVKTTLHRTRKKLKAYLTEMEAI